METEKSLSIMNELISVKLPSAKIGPRTAHKYQYVVFKTKESKINSETKNLEEMSIHFSCCCASSAETVSLSFIVTFNNNKKRTWYADHQLSGTSRPRFKSHISARCCSQLVSAGSLLTG